MTTTVGAATHAVRCARASDGRRAPANGARWRRRRPGMTTPTTSEVACGARNKKHAPTNGGSGGDSGGVGDGEGASASRGGVAGSASSLAALMQLRARLPEMANPSDAATSTSTSSQASASTSASTSTTTRLEDQRVRVSSTKNGRRGKTVTIVRGLTAVPSNEESLKTFTQRLKKALGVGGAIDTDGDASSLVFQGDHVDSLIAALIAVGYTNTKRGG
mmetsp:Transcript_9020/g.30451  ORF Transcript_9020/g.30451 Transcript_9020/m.30451 type:complete len:219 (+) Transcript_9020:813-1469(+)